MDNLFTRRDTYIQSHNVQRRWTICLHGGTLTDNLTMFNTVDNLFTRRDTYNLTLFNDDGQSVYTERHLQKTSQCSTTVDNLFTRRDTYRQPHNVQHDGGQSFDPWYLILRLWIYLRRCETDLEAQTEITLFKDCGHCVVKEKHRAHIVHRPLHLRVWTESPVQSMDPFTKRWDTPTQTELALFNDYGQ